MTRSVGHVSFLKINASNHCGACNGHVFDNAHASEGTAYELRTRTGNYCWLIIN